MNKYSFTIEDFNIEYPRFIKSKDNSKYYDFKKAVLSSNYSRTYQLNHRSTQSYLFDKLIELDYFKLLGINDKIFKEFVLINTDLDNDYRSYYLLDYFIPSKSICIELDSDYHNIDKDNRKDKFLNSLGIKVIRINDLQNNTKEKLDKIVEFIKSNNKEFNINYNNLIINSRSYSDNIIKNKLIQDKGKLYFISNKWKSKIDKLCEYDNNLRYSIESRVHYKLIININKLYELIPACSKEIRKYNALVNYLLSLGIELIITSKKRKYID